MKKRRKEGTCRASNSSLLKVDLEKSLTGKLFAVTGNTCAVKGTFPGCHIAVGSDKH